MKVGTKNILAAISVFNQLVIILILLVFHGADTETDKVFFSFAVLQTLQLIVLMSFDQFVVFYNKKNADSLEAADRFYYQVFVLSLLGSLIVITLALTLFISDLGGEVFLEYKKTGILNSFLWSLPAYALVALNDRYLNAIGEITKSYILVLIPVVSMLGGVVIWTFIYSEEGIVIIGEYYSVFMWIGGLLSTAYVFNKIKSKFYFDLIGSKEFVLNSFFMRIGHNIYAISFQLITSSMLFAMTEGVLSMFNYAQRSVTAIAAVAVTPANRVYMYQLAKDASNNKLVEFRKYVKPYLKEVFTLYLALVFLAIIALLSAYFINAYFQFFTYIFDEQLFLSLFIIIVLWQTVVIFETVYLGVLITLANYKIFIVINSMFAICYFVLTTAVSSFNNVSLFALTSLFSQIIILYVYKRYVKKYINKSKKTVNE